MIAYAGFYKSSDGAEAAQAQLSADGFETQEILVLSPSDTAAFEKAAQSKGWKDDLAAVSNRITGAMKDGHSVVVVRARLGTGQRATTALEAGSPAKIVSGSKGAPRHWTEFFGLPMLAEDRSKTRLKSYNVTAGFGPTILKVRGERKSSFGIPLVIEKRGENKSSLGLPNSTSFQFSKMFGMPMVIQKRSKK